MIRRERPKLRPIRAFRVERDGQRVVRIIDPLGIGPALRANPWFVSEDEWAIARLFDGEHTAGDIAAKLDQENQDEHVVMRVVEAFSKQFLLENDEFEEALFRELDGFRKLPFRSMVGSGHEYTSDNIDLRIQLGGIVADDWDMPQIEPVHALWLPAAPFGPAAKLYARGYASIRHQVADIARIVILGTSDVPLDRLLVPLTLSSKTAFGISRLDTTALSALSIVPGRDEIAHRESLVVERHQLFTTLLAPEVPVLPLLVGQIRDANSDQVDSAVQALLRVLELPGRTLLIAAADMAYLEPSAEPRDRGQRTEDATLSDCATRIAPAEFWEQAQKPSPIPRNVSSAYLLLRVLSERSASARPLRGAVAGYLQMRTEPMRTSAATIAFFEDLVG